ncbi:hypothetical protein D3C80_1302260 [compost metagenome]
MIKQDVSQLFRRIHVEIHSCQFFDFLFKNFCFLGQLFGVSFQMRSVNCNSLFFHSGKYGNQRHFHLIEQFLQMFFFNLRCKKLFQLEGNIGIFTSIVADCFRLQITHISLALSFFTDKCFNADRSIIQIVFRQEVHSLFCFRLNEVMSDHRIEQRSVELNSVTMQNLYVVFHIVSNLFDAFVLKERFEFIYNCLSVFLVFRNSNIVCFALFERERHSDQISMQGINARRFGIKTNRCFFQ